VADQKITQLNALLAADAQATVDVLPVADVSTAETKKITLADAVTSGIGSIANNTIPGAKLQNGSVTATQIGTGVVGTTQLTDSGITTAKINDGAVTTAKIAADAVTATEIAANAIGSSELADNAVDTAAIQNNAVTTAKVADGSITAAKIAPGVLGDTQIADGSITSSKLADGAVTTAKIADDGVTSAKLATGAVDTTALGSAAVTAAKIADGTVTAAKLANDLDGSEFLAQAPNTVLAGPTSGANAVPGFRALTATDIPLLTASNLPIAATGVRGSVSVGTGLSADGSGVLSISNTVAGATATKVTYNSSGLITASASLADTDIPALDASKITTGTFGTSLIANSAITGAKIANESTVLFGGAGSTAGVVTFPNAQFKGQYFYDELNQDLYIWSGSAWLPVTIISGELIYAGTYNASVNQVASITSAGGAVGLTVGVALPAASSSNSRYYLVVSDSGTGSGNAPAEPLAPPDMILSNGTSWDLIDVSNAIAGQTATNISFTPYGGIIATNVQSALQELDDDKLAKAGGTVTGQVLIGTTGSLVFEGSTADDFETTLAVTDPTADRTITLPNVTGTVVTTGDTGTVTSTMIADGTIVNADIASGAAIDYSKLAPLTSGNIVLGSGANVATSTAVTGDVTISNTGVTAISSGVIVDADINASAAISGSKIAAGTTSVVGVVQLTDSFSSTSTSTAATPNAVKSAYDLANAALPKSGGTMTGAITFAAGQAITGYATLATAQSFTAAQRGSVVALTDGATITPDFAAGNNFSVTLGGNRTLANPSNLTAGQAGTIVITQDGTGSRTLAYGSNWKFPGGTAPTLTTTASAVDVIAYYVESATRITSRLISDVK